MAGVPQKTLNWLYDVLKREYRDPNRTYSDLAHVLARNPGFAPRTDVYTSENGVSALLVHFTGTIPVNFRGNTYRFPISLWIPHAYPYEPPICYVMPTEDMVVRPGQHVGGDGRIYHPYLAHWREAWERSNTVDFLSILSDVFAKEPPVISRGQQRAPPPVPRLPRELSGPPPPPKPMVPSSPTQAQGRHDVTAAQHPGRYDAPPPLPQPQSPRPYGNGDYMPHRTSSLRQSMLPQQQYRPQPQQYQIPPSTHAPRPPVQQQQPPPPKSAPDLLDSPFDVTLPAQTPTPSNIPAPPIPINPEKEALLTHLSHQITHSLHSQIAQSTSAIPALQSQNGALQSTLHNLSAELNNLQSLHSTLTSNLSLLSTSLSKSDNVISSAKKRAAEKDIPAVDDMLVPPTVVARQLYDTACEERGIEAAILALQEAFVRGRVGADVWSRKTRELAREGFKRKWMETKVARGMGLDLSMYGS